MTLFSVNPEGHNWVIAFGRGLGEGPRRWKGEDVIIFWDKLNKTQQLFTLGVLYNSSQEDNHYLLFIVLIILLIDINFIRS